MDLAVEEEAAVVDLVDVVEEADMAIALMANSKDKDSNNHPLERVPHTTSVDISPKEHVKITIAGCNMLIFFLFSLLISLPISSTSMEDLSIELKTSLSTSINQLNH